MNAIIRFAFFCLLFTNQAILAATNEKEIKSEITEVAVI